MCLCVHSVLIMPFDLIQGQQSEVEWRFHTPSVLGKRQQLACCHCITIIIAKVEARSLWLSKCHVKQCYILKLTSNLNESDFAFVFRIKTSQRKTLYFSFYFTRTDSKACNYIELQ